MPKKKKKWQRATWLPRKREKKKKGGNITGNVVAQKEKKKKWGNVATYGREKKEKKCNLNWGYLCKVHLSALFSPHFSPKLGE